ncbi:hypothetical protein [Rufibacter roseus]
MLSNRWCVIPGTTVAAATKGQVCKIKWADRDSAINVANFVGEKTRLLF